MIAAILRWLEARHRRATVAYLARQRRQVQLELELALLRARNLDLEVARLRLTDQLQAVTEERDAVRREVESLADEWGTGGSGRLGAALELRASLQRGVDCRG